MIKKEIMDFVVSNIEEIRNLRHYFHQYPEKSMHEYDTTNKLRDILISLNFKVIELGKTGLIGTLQKGNGQKIAIRSQIDALEIDELNENIEYKSLNKYMHASGHDGHMAIAIGVCKYFSNLENFNGTLIVIFEPGEQICMGSKFLIENELLNKIRPDKIYSLNNVPHKLLKNGKAGDLYFFDEDKPLTATNDLLEYKILGKGTHVACPQFGKDPIITGINIINGLQNILSKNISPFDKAIISVGSFDAGTVANVIPSSATIKLCIRTLDENVRMQILKKIDEYVDKTCILYGCHFVKSEIGKCGMVKNNVEVTKFAKNIAIKTFGEDRVHKAPQTMLADDISSLLDIIPGSLIYINNGESSDLHNHTYNFNDDIIPYGLAFLITLLNSEFA